MQPFDPLIGRDWQLEELQSLLDEARSVTLWGPAGVGKTRLARELRRTRETQGRPTLSCELAEARDAAAVCRSVGDALDVSPQPGSGVDDYAAQLGYAIAARGELLAVLDNVEAAANVAAPLLARWLEQAPELRVLATSRERLRLAGERPLELQPLSIDAGIALFVERAREIRPGYAPEAAERRELAELVRRLDGLPLAIELAAARLGVLGVDGLLFRLDERLKLLTRGRRGAEGRQRSLRAAFDASWEMLDEPERRALAWVSVFPRSFALDAAEALLGSDAVDLLDRLRDRSLVRIAEQRAELLDSIRLWAAEQLEALGERRLAERAHLRWLASDAPCWPLSRLAEERADMRSAMQRFAEDEGAGPELARAAVRVVLAFDRLLAASSTSDEWATVLEHVLSKAERLDAPRPEHVELQLAWARALSMGGATGRALRLEERARERARALGDAALEAKAMATLGATHYMQGRLPEARRAFEAARELGAVGAVAADVSGGLGAVTHVEGELTTAQRYYEQALQQAREHAEERLELRCLSRLGFLALDRGRIEEASRYYEQALERQSALGDRRGAAITRGYLGNLARRRGAFAEAEAAYRGALDELRALGDRSWEAVVRMDLGILRYAQGALERALEALSDAAQLADATANQQVGALSYGYLATARADASDHDGAVAAARTRPRAR